jgi:hypothetical protein
MLSIKEWNDLKKPDNIDVMAEEGDIVEEIDGIMFLLQTRNGFNNVVAFRIKKSDKHIIWSLYSYCILLYDKYGIEYIRVEGDKGKYDFLKRFFSRKKIVKDKDISERDVYYCNLKECLFKMKLKVREYEFYYTQNTFLNTDDVEVKKECYQKMFMAVKFAVENAMKKRFGNLAKKGVVRNDFYDMVLDATMNIMNRYNKPKGYKIYYLLTTADYASLGALHNPKQKFQDSMISLDYLISYGYKKRGE